MLPEAPIVDQVTNSNPESAEPEGAHPIRSVTVRMPKPLHEALKSEASLRKTSMNQLCIAKLKQHLVEPTNV